MVLLQQIGGTKELIISTVLLTICLKCVTVFWNQFYCYSVFQTAIGTCKQGSTVIDSTRIWSTHNLIRVPFCMQNYFQNRKQNLNKVTKKLQLSKTLIKILIQIVTLIKII